VTDNKHAIIIKFLSAKIILLKYIRDREVEYGHYKAAADTHSKIEVTKDILTTVKSIIGKETLYG